jgi:hypothetical protein
MEMESKFSRVNVWFCELTIETNRNSTANAKIILMPNQSVACHLRTSLAPYDYCLGKQHICDYILYVTHI